MGAGSPPLTQAGPHVARPADPRRGSGAWRPAGAGTAARRDRCGRPRRRGPGRGPGAQRRAVGAARLRPGRLLLGGRGARLGTAALPGLPLPAPARRGRGARAAGGPGPADPRLLGDRGGPRDRRPARSGQRRAGRAGCPAGRAGRRGDGGRVLRRVATGRGDRDGDPSGALRVPGAARGAGRARDLPRPRAAPRASWRPAAAWGSP